MSLEKITVMGKVNYKQVVTEQYKEKARAEVRDEIAKLDDEIANFDKQMNKTITELTLKAHPQTEALRQQFNAERDKILVYKDQLLQAEKTIEDLVMDSQVDAGEGNFVTELKVGESFNNNLNCDIVVKDDVVIAINTHNG